ncbi:DUF3488 and DUF4129 domain-containing transglutaminase family protein [Desulforhabdus sp. TSK]|uniref:transglutaminase TgpA family protein n=1 Tax=Desulforhabdus sp. TSK TaxID=2925014 RepID=UPI001FC84C12|nr:DUF3488 and DUF4129 domain-containing transglutaminase family protein [Desulforhabdus sp. TSK]GKT06940.1 hypothetical protein DSTSK_02450 [Desulforhabdus sp. TSK]
MVKIKDTLKISTYACALTGYASVIQHVEKATALLFAGLLILAAGLDSRRPSPLPFKPPRWLLNACSVGILGFFFSRISATYLIEPILNALLLLVAVKLLEEKRPRDYMQVYLLCMFLLVGSSLLSLSAVFLVYFFLLVTLATFSLLLLAYFSQSEDLILTWDNVLKLARHALLISGIALPLTAVFFIILPRTSYPLLNFLQKREVSRTGFTDTVTLGQVSEIQENNQVVLRAEMPRVEERDLYWRGIVMDTFDGSAWSVGKTFKWGTALNPPAGDPVHQTVYLEPYGNRYLFALDKPVHIVAGGARRSQDATYTLRAPLERRIKYTAVSVLSPFLPDPSTEASHYLQLPPGFSPRVEKLVGALKKAAPGDQWVGALQRIFTGGDYQYSLQSLPVSENPLEDFLFVQKRGNCEYFASALAAMLRAGGIPSRVVGGYKGGFYNRAGGYYLVLQSNAHVWVEAYLKDGWLRLDPTPPLHEGLPAGGARDSSMQLKLAMDTVNYYWNRLVITYDLSRQMALLEWLRSSLEKPAITSWKPTLNKRSLLHYAGFPLLCLLACFCLYRFLTERKKPLDRIAARFTRKMAAHGYQKGKAEGLEEFVARIEEEPLREKAQRFVEDFEAIYYGDREATRHSLSRLRNRMREF